MIHPGSRFIGGQPSGIAHNLSVSVSGRSYETPHHYGCAGSSCKGLPLAGQERGDDAPDPVKMFHPDACAGAFTREPYQGRSG
jgi:hypothetical protein